MRITMRWFSGLPFTGSFGAFASGAPAADLGVASLPLVLMADGGGGFVIRGEPVFVPHHGDGAVDDELVGKVALCYLLRGFDDGLAYFRVNETSVYIRKCTGLFHLGQSADELIGYSEA